MQSTSCSQISRYAFVSNNTKAVTTLVTKTQVRGFSTAASHLAQFVHDEFAEAFNQYHYTNLTLCVRLCVRLRQHESGDNTCNTNKLKTGDFRELRIIGLSLFTMKLLGSLNPCSPAPILEQKVLSQCR